MGRYFLIRDRHPITYCTLIAPVIWTCNFIFTRFIFSQYYRSLTLPNQFAQIMCTMGQHSCITCVDALVKLVANRAWPVAPWPLRGMFTVVCLGAPHPPVSGTKFGGLSCTGHTDREAFNGCGMNGYLTAVHHGIYVPLTISLSHLRGYSACWSIWCRLSAHYHCRHRKY